MQDVGWLLPIAGGLAGIVIGAAARRDRFCTLAALERFWYANDSSGLRTWILAATVALIATQAMALTGLIDLQRSFYLSSNFGWTGAILGGLAFGFGMALVGTCGFGALVRLGGGSLRSLVVLLVLGLSALAAQRGLIAQARVAVVDNLAADLSFAGDQSLGSIASALLGFDARLAVAFVVAGLLLLWIFSSADYRHRLGNIITGGIIGLGVAFGWLATTWVAQRAFEPVQIEAGSFVVPVGDTLIQFIAFTGVLPDYGVGLVVGVGLGAALVAWRKKDVRWEACDDARELGRHIVGAFLMGTGGVFAMGCTIGQGVTAVSALAISAPVVMLSIAIGARLGLAYLLEGSIWSVFRITHHESAE
ncbi:YeeE/YedE family protein [Pelagibius marinus]|uniref:YeeE/YedE family protein n=1 Tax=Pelagibius marinus TaxID=2762760 RepID=UPI001872EF02|nr:YeeE/YedE family protein [Pelagibius marinus]